LTTALRDEEIIYELLSRIAGWRYSTFEIEQAK